MIQWREGRVAGLGRQWDGAQELDVDVYDPGARRWVTCPALAYPRLVGSPTPGELVLLNTTAIERGPATGQYALVISRAGHLPDDAPLGQGHLVKARGTAHQVLLEGADEHGSPHHEPLADADDLLGMPVVTVEQHAGVPAVLSGVRLTRPAARVAYVMTDGGALPAWSSRTLSELREAGLLAVTITVGQAFGGDLEAVTLHSGLLAARLVAGADVAVVAPGPGQPGAASRWGSPGVAAGEAVNAAGVLRGRPVACLRVADSDLREGARGISRHSLTAYGRVALLPADVVVPGLPGPFGDLVRSQAAHLEAPEGRHQLVEIPTDGLREALEALPVALSAPGPGPVDEAAVLSLAAAGVHAAQLLTDPDGDGVVR